MLSWPPFRECVVRQCEVPALGLRRIGDLRDLRVTIVGTPRAPAAERRSSLAFLPTRASGAPQKLQFTHEILVELSVSKKVELALNDLVLAPPRGFRAIRTYFSRMQQHFCENSKGAKYLLVH